MGVIFEISLFILSFLPLWLSVLFIDVVSIFREDNNIFTEELCLFFIPICIVIAFIICWKQLTTHNKQNKEKYEIKEAKENKFETITFLLSYVVPLFAFDFTKWDGMILFGGFFLSFYYLIHRHNIFCPNIVLDIFNYKVFICKIENNNRIIEKQIISKNQLESQVGDSIRTMKINNEYQFEVRY